MLNDVKNLNFKFKLNLFLIFFSKSGETWWWWWWIRQQNLGVWPHSFLISVAHVCRVCVFVHVCLRVCLCLCRTGRCPRPRHHPTPDALPSSACIARQALLESRSSSIVGWTGASTSLLLTDAAYNIISIIIILRGILIILSGSGTSTSIKDYAQGVELFSGLGAIRSAKWPLKVIQGHWFRYQSKACMQVSIGH